MPQHRLLSIALNTMHRHLSHDWCWNPCLCHICVENYAYQTKRLWRWDSNPWSRSLLLLYIVFNILHTINYIYLNSLSVPVLRPLSIALNTTDRDLSHDSYLNPGLCHIWVENYAYQRKRLWREDSNTWRESLLIMYILFNILHNMSYICLKSLSMPQLRFFSIALNTTDRDLSYNSILNYCLCHILVENYAYQRKSMESG